MSDNQEIEMVIREPNYCPHGADLNYLVCHKCDGSAIYTQSELDQHILEAKIEELEKADRAFTHERDPQEWAENRIKELSNKKGDE